MKKKEEMRGEKKQHAPLRAFLFFLIALLVYEIGRTAGTLAVGLLSGPLLVGMGGKGAEGLQDGLMLLAAPLGGAVACIGGRNKLHRRMGRRESRCRYAWLSWFSRRLPRWD